MHPELVDQSYDAWVAEELGPHGDEPCEVTDDERAMWAVRKIAAAEALVAERKATMARDVARLERWVEAAKRQATSTRTFFEGKLEGYFLRLDDASKLSGKKTYVLANGRLKKRTAPAKWVIDQERLLAWARPKGLVHVKEEADWATIKALLDLSADRVGEPAVHKLTGEVLECICVEYPSHEVFSVDVDVAA